MATNYYYRLRDYNATKPTPIILIAQIAGNRIKCKTELSILPSDCMEPKKPKEPKGPKESKESMKLPIDNVKNKTLQRRLIYLLTVANDTYLYFRDTDKNAEPNNKEYQNKFYEKAGIDVPQREPEPETITFFKFLDGFIDRATTRINDKTGKKLSHITICNFRQLRNQLLTFDKKVCKVDFDKIDSEFYDKFNNFMFAQNYSINTVGKHIRMLKTVLNDATEKGYNSNRAYQSSKFKAHNAKTESIYLNDDEINELHKLDLSKTPHLERVRDLFLVGCYTGLRYSDFNNIRPEDIEDGFIEITQQKTSEPVVVPIHPKLFEIMGRYRGKTPNSLPPTISNQKMNDHLKTICSKVKVLNDSITTISAKGIYKVSSKTPKYMSVTTHTARRSFATNQYERGIPANLLMKITGHATESAFYRYIKTPSKESAKKLLELWQKEYSHLKVV